MKVMLLQLDGKMPNCALMRLASHHKKDLVAFDRAPTVESILRDDWSPYDRIYASLIFERTRPVAEALLARYPQAIVGGTGYSLTSKLEDFGVTTTEQDYSIYPLFQDSIGFSQRGCRLNCSFCVVPRKEGKVSEERSIYQIWRGHPYPRHIVLLDNDFFGQPRWRDRIAEMRQGDFRVSFNQGINCRMINDESAEAIASVLYYDDQFQEKRIYTAWDSLPDEKVLFRGLEALVRHGISPRQIMVYMLIGFWPGETAEDRDYRRSRLREFGAIPYPMPFVRPPHKNCSCQTCEFGRELVGFQRWVSGAYDKRFSWAHWQKAGCRPENLHKYPQET